MSKNWQQLLFETCELGVSSAVAPELLPPNQVAWGMNIDVRGGKPGTRPNLVLRTDIPDGLIQGAEYFSIQNGMIVFSVAGRLYRLRINADEFSVEEIPLTFQNSGILKQVWMTQTVETLVIQDGQSNAILYDGSTAVRAGPDQVPRGRQMAYGNGRLWVAVNANEVVAGDIRTSAQGSELLFTETNFLAGGGKLFFPSAITGMAFIPLTGQSDYGALMVFAAQEASSIRADITSRDDWGKIPGFVSYILRSVGAASQWSIVSVNQDLYWRDSNGGIRSIRNALADEAGPGSAPVSREVSRLTDFDSEQLLPWCSGVYFENRLLMTSSPFLMPNGGRGWKNLISLDFAPLSTMGGKSQPAYNGQWNGLNFVKLVSGKFNGINRSFAFTTDADGDNQIWEFDDGHRADEYFACTDGTADVETAEWPITCFVEYPRRNFGVPKQRKLLTRCDVWLSSLDGDVNLKVQWRADNAQKWLLWDQATTCAKTTDASTAEPHVWKNLLGEERPQFKTFTIPDGVNEVTKYATQVGFEFQIRLVWTGRVRIHRVMTYASLESDPDFADRSGFEVACVENDVTGNEVPYQIPTNGCDQGTIELTCESESGTGTLCGFSEFTNPSTPPKKYRRKDMTGQAADCNWEDGTGCTGVSLSSGNDVRAGFCIYDASTCALTNNQTRGVASVNAGSCVVPPPDSAGSQLPCDYDDACVPPGGCGPLYPNAAVQTQTTRAIVGAEGVCFDDTVFPGVSRKYSVLTINSVLSVEDTEEDAMARASKTPGVSCTASIEPRGAGDFTFAFSNVSFDLDIADLLPGQSYTALVDIDTQPYGGGTPVITTLEYVFTATGTTHQISDVVPCDYGKQATVQNPRINFTP